jgi:hypothetical protein
LPVVAAVEMTLLVVAVLEVTELALEHLVAGQAQNHN